MSDNRVNTVVVAKIRIIVRPGGPWIAGCDVGCRECGDWGFWFSSKQSHRHIFAPHHSFRRVLECRDRGEFESTVAEKMFGNAILKRTRCCLASRCRKRSRQGDTYIGRQSTVGSVCCVEVTGGRWVCAECAEEHSRLLSFSWLATDILSQSGIPSFPLSRSVKSASLSSIGVTG